MLQQYLNAKYLDTGRLAHYGNRTHDLFFTKEVLCL